jgi:hypothetical protein
MTRKQFWALTAAAVVAAMLLISHGWSDDNRGNNTPTQGYYWTTRQVNDPLKSTPVARDDGKSICTIYSLSDLGDDPQIGQWLLEGICGTIEPGTWNTNGQYCLSYCAPKKLLLVKHRPAVQAEVKAFLNKVRQAANGKEAAKGEPEPTVRQAILFAPNPAPAYGPARPSQPGPLGYPVPAPTHQPKHLFHFIIRYEGEGVIDNNVAEMLKKMNVKVDTANNAGPAPVCAPAVPGPLPAPPLSGPVPVQYLQQPPQFMPPPGVQYLQHPPQYMPPTPRAATRPAKAGGDEDSAP